MSNCSAQRRSRQHNCVRQAGIYADSNTFFNALTDQAMLEKIESLQPDHRERFRSCQHAVDEWSTIRQASGLSSVSTNTSAYCRARKRLPTDMIRQLVRHSALHLDNREPAFSFVLYRSGELIACVSRWAREEEVRIFARANRWVNAII